VVASRCELERAFFKLLRGSIVSKKISLCLILGLLCAGGASALDETDKRYIDRLIKGGPDTIREVAESLFQSGSTNTEVLDVAAEVLLEKYPRASLDRNSADSVAWLCKALGGSGNNRYKAVIDEVADKAENKKLRGHCDKARDALPKGATNSYTAGTVNLEALRNPPPVVPVVAAAPAAAKGKSKASAPVGKSTPASASAPAPVAAPVVAKPVDFSLVREGMSSTEVTEILGMPTAQSQHMTGKQFQPFNFGARDLQRMNYLYKGVGRIEFSLKSAYQGVFRVIKITPDPTETGYP
jgi:hypothetical protein